MSSGAEAPNPSFADKPAESIHFGMRLGYAQSEMANLHSEVGQKASLFVGVQKFSLSIEQSVHLRKQEQWETKAGGGIEVYQGEFMSGRKYGLPHIHNPHGQAPTTRKQEKALFVNYSQAGLAEEEGKGSQDRGTRGSIACPSDLSEGNEKKLWELNEKKKLR
ncbi:hypothetical protein B0H17DRAFT_1144603 [Mycena rosella]|uniref:Uncharacterized protein n=1 Tax=Mycena rosella TaxID=1033263 RepID=A0AAD7CSN8_MYCRO|nr:hypothetical protein B0H17DRAFT_1144603 [Mycena rosella]